MKCNENNSHIIVKDYDKNQLNFVNKLESSKEQWYNKYKIETSDIFKSVSGGKLMKRKSIVLLSLVLSTTLIGCGSNEPKEVPKVQTQTQVENSQETKIEMPKYSFEELGESEYKITIYMDEIIAIRTGENLQGYMDKDGNIVCEPKYTWLTYGDGMLALEDPNPSGSGMGKRYFQSLDGKITIDKVNGLSIGNHEDFKDGYAVVCLLDSDGEFQDTYKVIDKQGKVVLENDKEDAFYRRGENGNIYLTDGYFVYEGYKKDLTPLTEEEISKDMSLNVGQVTYADGLYVIGNSEDTITAFYDNETKQAISDYNIFVNPRKVGDNYIVAKQDENEEQPYWYIINDKYENIAKIDFDFVYTNTPDVINDKIALFYEGGGKTTIIDDKGNVFKELSYDYIYQLDDVVYCVVGNKIGILDAAFNEVVAPEYDEITEFNDGVGYAQKGKMMYKVKANN